METKSLTYKDLGAALGITSASAKRLAILRGWHKTQGKDGKARVAVPIECLEAKRALFDENAGHAPGDAGVDMSGAVTVLERQVNRLEGELAAIQAKLATVEGERDAERVKAGQVAVLEAVLQIERDLIVEVRQEAERWREAATAPRRDFRAHVTHLVLPILLPTVMLLSSASDFCFAQSVNYNLSRVDDWRSGRRLRGGCVVRRLSPVPVSQFAP